VSSEAEAASLIAGEVTHSLAGAELTPWGAGSRCEVPLLLATFAFPAAEQDAARRKQVRWWASMKKDARNGTPARASMRLQRGPGGMKGCRTWAIWAVHRRETPAVRMKPACNPAAPGVISNAIFSTDRCQCSADMSGCRSITFQKRNAKAGCAAILDGLLRNAAHQGLVYGWRRTKRPDYAVAVRETHWPQLWSWAG
jgi:hypothetical protein